MRPIRSVLFVPGDRADRFPRAAAADADAVVFDLEDGVDVSRKGEARRAVAEWLAAAPASRTARFVRVNASGSTWQAEDLVWLAVVSGHIDGIVLPKAESPDDIERVAQSSPQSYVIPLLETARGIIGAAAIAAARARIPALLFGAEDFTAELGIPRTLDGEELLLARSQVVLAAAAIGADAIDAVFVDLAAPDQLRQDAVRARALGFRGKMAIHPDQVATINDVFSPSADEVARARRLIEAADAARQQGDGAFRFENRMVDAPVVARARRVLALAEALAKSGSP
jgi:citrate lyase subunit beta / citryl-CoA lyase